MFVDKYNFTYKLGDKGILVSLIYTSNLGKKRCLDFNEWSNLNKKIQSKTQCIIDYILSEHKTNEAIEVDEDSIILKYENLNFIPEYIFSSLGIQDLSDTLHISNVGNVFEDRFTIKTKWTKPDASPLIGAHTKGNILICGSNVRGRLSDKTYSIINAINDVNNATNKEDRLQMIANLNDIFVSGDPDQNIQADGHIKNIRVYHAASFSLDVIVNDNEFDFQPILHHKNPTNPEVEALLPPNYAKVFLEEKFPEKSGRDSYFLGEGVFLVTTPSVAKSLSVVHKIQRSSVEEKKDFLTNPHKYINNELKELNLEDDDLESIFLETKSYSDRVVDVGLWVPPVLPWVKGKSNEWLPGEEKLGLMIGDTRIQIPVEKVDTVQKQVKEALSNNLKDTIIEGVKIPVNNETLEAVNSLVSILKPKKYKQEKLEKEQGSTQTRTVLKIKDNLGCVTYSSDLNRRGEALESVIATYMKHTPKPYQQKGLNWLQNSWASGVSGVLLADDMGLGKTFQVLSFISWLKEYQKTQNRTYGPVLIVAPTSLIENWNKEANLHLYDAEEIGKLIKLQGRDLSYYKTGNGSHLDHHEIQSAGWVITSYETMRDYEQSFGKINFSVIVFDEIQKLKSPSSLVTKAAKAMNGDFLIGLTGTPVENRLADLHTIADVLRPGFLGALKDFSQKYEKDPNESDLKQLKNTIESDTEDCPSFMLRRMKSDELQGMPRKEIYIKDKYMPQRQSTAYEQVISQSIGKTKHMLQALQEMRNISLHPYKFDTNAKSNTNKYIQESAKLSVCFDILDEIASKNEKVLIFLESRELQPTLKRMISQKYNVNLSDINIINGDTQSKQRQDFVNQFQDSSEGFGVMILSPKAAGTGLTITAANNVIHLSRWWNPAVEDQSTDRAYRIGQTKDVSVYYPMSIHPHYGDKSFDVILDQLIEKKREQANELLMPLKSLDGHQAELAIFKKAFSNDYHEGEFRNDLLTEIDSLNFKQFEMWALDVFKNNGFKVKTTPRSWDFGADGFAENDHKKFIIQCKHTSNIDKPCNDNVVEELLKAQNAYEQPNSQLIAVTNAVSFSNKVVSLARQNNIKLIDRNNIIYWSENIHEI